jgi:hypothetical protein
LHEFLVVDVEEMGFGLNWQFSDVFSISFIRWVGRTSALMFVAQQVAIRTSESSSSTSIAVSLGDAMIAQGGSGHKSPQLPEQVNYNERVIVSDSS